MSRKSLTLRTKRQFGRQSTFPMGRRDGPFQAGKRIHGSFAFGPRTSTTLASLRNPRGSSRPGRRVGRRLGSMCENSLRFPQPRCLRRRLEWCGQKREVRRDVIDACGDRLVGGVCFSDNLRHAIFGVRAQRQCYGDSEFAPILLDCRNFGAQGWRTKVPIRISGLWLAPQRGAAREIAIAKRRARTSARRRGRRIEDALPLGGPQR